MADEDQAADSYPSWRRSKRASPSYINNHIVIRTIKQNIPIDHNNLLLHPTHNTQNTRTSSNLT